VTTPDAHIQHTWTLANATDEEISIDLWTDNYTVRIDGGPDDGDQREGGRADVDHLLTKYQANGYRLVRDYAVNDPADPDAEGAADGEPDGKPDACPECGSPVAFEPRYVTDVWEGDAWLCTGCRWGRFVTA
jgi:hypothetical protein